MVADRLGGSVSTARNDPGCSLRLVPRTRTHCSPFQCGVTALVGIGRLSWPETVALIDVLLGV